MNSSPNSWLCGQVEISALRLNQMAIAFEIAIRRDGYYGFYHIAYPLDFHKHSPGKQLVVYWPRTRDERGLRRVRLHAGRARLQAEIQNWYLYDGCIHALRRSHRLAQLRPRQTLQLFPKTSRPTFALPDAAALVTTF